MLADLLGVKAQGALIRSRFQSITQMDAPSKFFFNLELEPYVESMEWDFMLRFS